jgi:hypothetical protein
MEEYPFLSKIKEKIKSKEKSVGWFIGEIERSERWVTGLKDIDKVLVGDVLKISEVLEFDFLADYHTWLNREIPVLSIVKEPQIVYGASKADDITITINMRGNIKKATKVLSKVKEVTEQEGFKID